MKKSFAIKSIGKTTLAIIGLIFFSTSLKVEANISNHINSNKNKFISFWGKDYDQKTGDIIDKEMDEYGEMRDCTRGKSSKKRKLPSCNDIVDQRQKYYEERNKKSNKLFQVRLIGENIFNLPNNLTIKVSSAIKYNDETQVGRGGGELIINAEIERITGDIVDFENIFIEKGSRLFLSFLDGDNFELLDALNIPLHIETGLTNNIKYRKKNNLGSTDLKAIVLQTRVPIRSIREYEQISKIDISGRFRK